MAIKLCQSYYDVFILAFKTTTVPEQNNENSEQIQTFLSSVSVMLKLDRPLKMT